MAKSFAIVPAAGVSARMGVPKLLLPLGGKTVIEHVLVAWTASAVTRVVVVARADDAELLERCRAFDVDAVAPPVPPADMRSSVALALRHIEACYAPTATDAWLLAPADMPALSIAAINRVLCEYDSGASRAIALSHQGRRGHPVAAAWSLAARVFALAEDEGVNALLRTVDVHEVEWPDATVLADLDMPDDYSRARDALH